ncbi:hypothetical protein K3495_g1919 [Podosphaera aphanis]|nr:hypothetical protein K3495_g1919 [Podosphaera aphanis]
MVGRVQNARVEICGIPGRDGGRSTSASSQIFTVASCRPARPPAEAEPRRSLPAPVQLPATFRPESSTGQRLHGRKGDDRAARRLQRSHTRPRPKKLASGDNGGELSRSHARADGRRGQSACSIPSPRGRRVGRGTSESSTRRANPTRRTRGTVSGNDRRTRRRRQTTSTHTHARLPMPMSPSPPTHRRAAGAGPGVGSLVHLQHTSRKGTRHFERTRQYLRHMQDGLYEIDERDAALVRSTARR